MCNNNFFVISLHTQVHEDLHQNNDEADDEADDFDDDDDDENGEPVEGQEDPIAGNNDNQVRAEAAAGPAGGLGFVIGAGLGAAHQALLLQNSPTGFQQYIRPSLFPFKVWFFNR